MNYHSTRTAASKSPAISFAATTQARKAFFAYFFTLEKVGGLPATSRQPEEILAGQTPACVSESVPLPKPDFSLPGIGQKTAADLSADTPARQVCGAAKPFPSLRRVWPQTGWCIPLHEGVRPLPFFGVKKAAKHAVPRRQAGCALQRPRRRRTGGAKLLPPHAAGVRKSAFFR